MEGTSDNTHVGQDGKTRFVVVTRFLAAVVVLGAASRAKGGCEGATVATRMQVTNA